MKKNLLYIALALSVLTNVVILCVSLKGNSSDTTSEKNPTKEASLFQFLAGRL